MAKQIPQGERDLGRVVATVRQLTNEAASTATTIGEIQQDITDLENVVHREVLTANRTYYVRSDGSDSNTGLANTSGGAFLTIQKAIDTILTLDLGGYAVTVSVGAGTFTTQTSVTSPPVGGLVTISGAGATTILSVTSGQCLSLSCPTTITIQNVKLQTTTAGNCLYATGGGANISLGVGVEFGACAGAHIWCQNSAYCSITTSYTISGAAVRHMLCILDSTIEMSVNTVTISGTPAFSSEFIYFASAGSVSLFGVTFSGSATGKRYTGSSNGVLLSYGAGTASSYFPGNSNGTTASGAQQL